MRHPLKQSGPCLPYATFTGESGGANNVETILLPVRQALHKLGPVSEGLPFTHTLNVYRGCRHACPFCFARYTHWFLGFADQTDFERKIFVKINLPEVLEKELKKNRPRLVSLGAATDPYQPLEKKFRLTRRCLEILLRYEIPFSFSTKSDLVLQDLELFARAARKNLCSVAFTLTTLDHTLQKFLEPHAAPVPRRIEALQALKAAGVPTGIHAMPILPYLTDDDVSLKTLFALAARLSVDFVYWNTLRLRGAIVKEYYLNRLKAFRPEAALKTKKLYGRFSLPPPAYQRKLAERIRFWKEKYAVRRNAPEFFLREQTELFELSAPPAQASFFPS